MSNLITLKMPSQTQYIRTHGPAWFKYWDIARKAYNAKLFKQLKTKHNDKTKK